MCPPPHVGGPFPSRARPNPSGLVCVPALELGATPVAAWGEGLPSRQPRASPAEPTGRCMDGVEGSLPLPGP